MSTVAGKKKSSQEPRIASPAAALPPTLLHHKHLLFNRELSWLEFNRRVLEEGLDQRQPLLERLKFLAIFSTNLDEYFMIRVSGLKEALNEDDAELSPDGMTPAEQLAAISLKLRPMVREQMRCLREEILPQFEAHDITIRSYAKLSVDERRSADRYFAEQVFPVLTPQAVDPSHPFPYVSSLSLNLGMMVESLDAGANNIGAEGKIAEGRLRFARVKLPPFISRLVPIDGTKTRFTFLGSLVAANAAALFPEMRIGKSYLFRVTRDADIEILEDEAGDLLRVMQQQLHRRRFGAAVRLEVAAAMPVEMVTYLTTSIGLTANDVYEIDGPLNVPDLMKLYELERPELKDAPLRTSIPPALAKGKSVFDAIKQRDILLHHPYTSYSTVTDFINTAATDPQVLAIKMCLYRTGQHSPIVQSLMEASARGKQVAVLVELKARFDEENNIEWARRLERAGVHVVYGLLGLKTHCKLALVVRREETTLRRYVHIATGNYNPTTSRIYTDIGLFTADEEIGEDAANLFNYLTGYSRFSKYRRLLVAPVNLRERLLAFIEREATHAREGRPAHIIAKINSLTDIVMIRSLYAAAQAGVKIDLVVRGICALRPGVPGVSEGIKVSSVVGRFLEHSRIFYFANGGAEELFIGSADWMQRNLDRRVEVVVPVIDARLRKQLKDVLDIYLRDNVKSRLLQPDGSYVQATAEQPEAAFDSQRHFSGA